MISYRLYEKVKMFCLWRKYFQVLESELSQFKVYKVNCFYFHCEFISPKSRCPLSMVMSSLRRQEWATTGSGHGCWNLELILAVKEWRDKVVSWIISSVIVIVNGANEFSMLKGVSSRPKGEEHLVFLYIANRVFILAKDLVAYRDGWVAYTMT